VSARQENQTVQRLLGAGDLRKAALACKALTERYSDYAPGWASACRVALALAHPAEAVAYIDRALRLAPDNAHFMILKAAALRSSGAPAEAASAASAAAARCGSDAAVCQALGNFHTAADEHREALRWFTRAVALDPQSADCRFNRATLLRIVGELEEAEAEYDRLIALEPHEYEAYYNRADLRRQSPERNHVAELEALVAAGIRHPRGEVLMRYALAKELEDLEAYPRSFEQLSLGARRRREHIAYDVQQDVATVDWIKAAFPPQRLCASAIGCPSDEPIFIVGMPRTGTTLLERSLGRHPDVFPAGELPHFANALTAAVAARTGVPGLSRRDLVAASAKVDFRAVGQDYLARTRPATGQRAHFIDKLPLNYLYCGLIHLSLPSARIIHLTRHPMATCHAVYKTLFKDAYPFSYDLREIARYYAAYRRLMSHWDSALPGTILHVGYEDLVEKFDSELRRVLVHCGLPWHDACLEFHRNPYPTATASAAQVRRPLYDSSVRLWEKYEDELRPLRAMLIEEGIPEAELARQPAVRRSGTVEN
jgi:tetratricopeptide (TPR) repeat protein